MDEFALYHLPGYKQVSFVYASYIADDISRPCGPVLDLDGTRWHRTGDAGYLDSEGRLWLLGRCQSVIKDGRGTLYPFAVEMVVQEHSFIARAALLHHKGQRVLFIEPVIGSDPPTQEQVFAMVPWANLDTIQFLKQIPVDRRHNAKVDYPRLQQMIN